MRSFGRTSALTLATLAVAVVAALWLTGSGSPGAEAEPSGGPGSSAEAARPGAEAGARAGPDRRLELEAPAGAEPVIWVRPGKRVAIRTEPGGGEVAEVVGRKTEFGSPTVFGVIETAGRWAGVSTAALPNDRLGWIRLDALRLGTSWTRQSIVVDLSERRAELREGERKVRELTVTVGAPASETPTGRFAVTDTFRGGLNPAYGCCAVAISATQPHVPSGWLGGNRIAFHGNGTGGPLGVAASNGCLRAADADVDTLVDRVGLGTPVLIRG